jgi:hypothetical protein
MRKLGFLKVLLIIIQNKNLYNLKKYNLTDMPRFLETDTRNNQGSLTSVVETDPEKQLTTPKKQIIDSPLKRTRFQGYTPPTLLIGQSQDSSSIDIYMYDPENLPADPREPEELFEQLTSTLYWRRKSKRVLFTYDQEDQEQSPSKQPSPIKRYTGIVIRPANLDQVIVGAGNIQKFLFENIEYQELNGRFNQFMKDSKESLPNPNNNGSYIDYLIPNSSTYSMLLELIPIFREKLSE